jgi:hypothetical protein
LVFPTRKERTVLWKLRDEFANGLGGITLGSVLNGTALRVARCDDERMSKAKKELMKATRASVREEMGRPRMARSARIAELNLDTTRFPEPPSTTMPGTVHKIIPPHPHQPGKAQIAVDGTGQRYRDLRIENTLTDEHGDDVKLEKGERVEVTVTAEPKTVSRRNRRSSSANF